MFSTRFDTDDAAQRALTLMQMFAVAVMAVNAKNPLGSHDAAGFAAAYAGMRFVLVVQYLRARQVGESRRLTSRFAAGYGEISIVRRSSRFTAFRPPADPGMPGVGTSVKKSARSL